MKVGDIVICIDNRDCDLTIGKRYPVKSIGQEHGDEFIKVIKDSGGLGGFMKFRFKIDESATVSRILSHYEA